MEKSEQSAPAIRWLGNGRFSVGDLTFIARNIDGADTESSMNQFFVMKPRKLIRSYERLIGSLRPRHILELGVFQGGSSVLFHALSSATRHVACELKTERIAVIDRYIAEAGLDDSLKLYYGVDQADVATLRTIVEREFANSIDLVIDDASHALAETRTSFNTLFPCVVPGGAYVIEDWPWAHARADDRRNPQGLHPEQEPLTKLLFEIAMACPSTDDIIDRIEIDRFRIVVWRGKGAIAANEFDIRDCLSRRSAELIA